MSQRFHTLSRQTNFGPVGSCKCFVVGGTFQCGISCFCHARLLTIYQGLIHWPLDAFRSFAHKVGTSLCDCRGEGQGFDDKRWQFL